MPGLQFACHESYRFFDLLIDQSEKNRFRHFVKWPAKDENSDQISKNKSTLIGLSPNYGIHCPDQKIYRVIAGPTKSVPKYVAWLA
ncbi:MAG: hypothetical protein DWI24_07920 [Planctomycetota bacterium]|nr:MAG: hypothetical protein DWI24_07920 [Planctomycetota bacterium]